MDTEAEGLTGSQIGRQPSGLHERQSWQPHALYGLESLLTGIMRHTGPFLSNTARLYAWCGQFARRVRPWWSPLSLVVSAGEGLPEGQMRAAQTTQVISRSESAHHTELSRVSNVRDLSGWLSVPSIPLQPIQHLNPVQPPRLVPALFRPAIESAVLQAAQTTPRSGSANHTELPSVPNVNDLRSWPPVFGVPAFQPALSFSVSSKSRRELRGGFPVSQPSQAMLTDVEQRKAAPAISPPAQQTADHMAPLFFTAEQAAARPGPTAGLGALEKLLERTDLPAPLPGIELRLVSPEILAPAARRPANDAEDGQPLKNELTPPAPVPAASPAPQLDINTVADRVYQTIIRRQQLERERRGLY